MALGYRIVKFLRTFHVYLGVFAAPALLFFAFTGGLQMFSLHETTRGSSYVPPAWLASAAHLHKKGTIVIPARRARPPVAAGAGASAPGTSTAVRTAQADAAPGPRATRSAPTPARLLAMKIFFALIAVSLLVSVLSGLVIAWRISQRPRLLGALVVAGTLVPIALLL